MFAVSPLLVVTNTHFFRVRTPKTFLLPKKARLRSFAAPIAIRRSYVIHSKTFSEIDDLIFKGEFDFLPPWFIGTGNGVQCKNKNDKNLGNHDVL